MRVEDEEVKAEVLSRETERRRESRGEGKRAVADKFKKSVGEEGNRRKV